MTTFLCFFSCFSSNSLFGQIELPDARQDQPVTISASRSYHWKQDTYEVYLLQGDCVIRQDTKLARSREAVLWIEHQDPQSFRPQKIVAYLEGDVRVDRQHQGPIHQKSGHRADTIIEKSWLGRFYSSQPIEMQLPISGSRPKDLPAIYYRGRQEWLGEKTEQIQLAQFTPPYRALPQEEDTGPGERRFQIKGRGSAAPRLEARAVPEQNEWIAVLDGGVNLVVDGLGSISLGGTSYNVDKIDIDADRIVVWAEGIEQVDLLGSTGVSKDRRIEIYLEGNIVFRQGDRIIYARSMYYNIAQEYGVVMNAELMTSVAGYQGIVRLKADVLQQMGPNNFQAHGAALTSSRMGVPRYWYQSETLTFQDIQHPLVNPFTGQAEVDLDTGRPIVEHQQLASSSNNFVYVGGVPVFYWPVMATEITDPTIYLDRISLKNDSVFGTQLLTDWNMYQLLGMSDPPAGTEWTASLDVLSERGLAGGTEIRYDRTDFAGIPGPYNGFLEAWIIKDQDFDNLGRDRRALVPEKDYRGFIYGQHQHFLPNGIRLTSEIGLISDRNFLEQYYEANWDEKKDYSTGIELKQTLENSTWSITGDTRINDFFTQTEWMPRLDHFVIGQSLLEDQVSWHAHSHAGYARLKTASTPVDTVDAAKFDPLAWEVASSGVRTATRHELDFPFQLGAFKMVPYLLGEVAYWEQDLTANDTTRTFGQVGLRASLPMWRADPQVQSMLLNLNGLAHKVIFDAELSWADANRDINRFPLYDKLDDDSVEHFRRRFFFDTFGGTAGGNVPLVFDERQYALRTGMQSWVTAPSTEIANDLSLLRLGARQRWQTKRGLPGNQRIIDWVVLDVEGTLFPDADRDNSGEYLGLVNYDFRWHVGDRLTLLSDGFTDLFEDGLRKFTVGGFINRPEIGGLYIGFRSLGGPIESNVISTSFEYRMSEKWLTNFGTSIDLGDVGNIGQSVNIIRIGESFLVGLGFHVDSSRRNVGIHLTLEPRFLRTSQRAWISGAPLPPAGVLGLE